MNNTDFHKKLQYLPNGANYVFYHEKRYLLRKDTLLNGKLIKIYAEELGGNDIVSGNYYISLTEETVFSTGRLAYYRYFLKVIK